MSNQTVVNQNSSNTINKEITITEPCLLISATYEKQKRIAVLKLYNPKTHKIILVDGDHEHKPYCLSKQSVDELSFLKNDDDGIENIQSIPLYDALKDEKIMVSKIECRDPLVIGGKPDSVRNRTATWESDIRYHETYLYDKQLIVGRYYTIEKNKLIEQDLKIPDEVSLALKALLWEHVNAKDMVDSKEFQEYIAEWANLLNQPIPKMKRLSLDIEVESEPGRLPDSKIANDRVTAVGLNDGEDFTKVYVLRMDGVEEGKEILDKDKIKFFNSEKEMLENVFDRIQDYPFLVTFNGDDFDLPYLYNRAKNLGINYQKIGFTHLKDSVTTTKGVHLDLYRTFFNKSFQIYAFSNKYTDFSLNSIAKALINAEKIDYGKDFSELTLNELASYCYNDAKITYELTSFNNDLLMNLLIVISRIARLPIDEVSRIGVSQWIRSLLYFEHRKRGILIPQRKELDERSQGVSNDAVIKDKKYRGGLVVDPIEGIHFKVVVMDFASLYPSIVKVNNLSHETVRCPHEECKKNVIPGTNHWVCKKKNGIGALLIGSLRDLRVNYYKSLSKNETLTNEQQQQYTVVSQALKVILNASYGVMGAEIFPLFFLPAAESTTAIGRYIIMQTIKKCEEKGIEVLYGDTDSLFLKNPNKIQIEEVIQDAKKSHGVDLEVDKTYKYVVLSNRKKNYFGVTTRGSVDVKGLTGKKSHTPPFIKKLFYEILDVLKEIETLEDFEQAKNKVANKISTWAKKLQEKSISMEDLSFRMILSKDPKDYTKTIPQHIRAANLLSNIREVKRGDTISFVKTTDKKGVKPVELASQNDVDSKKYLEFMESTLDQITSSMKLDFDVMVGRPKQTNLTEYFFN